MADPIPLSLLAGQGSVSMIPPDDVLAKMPWSDLYQLRLRHPDPELQARIAPFEHRAYARETVSEDPLKAPVMAMAVPGYQLLKTFVGKSRTRPSMDQVTQGLRGVGEGLTDWWNRPTPVSGT